MSTSSARADILRSIEAAAGSDPGNCDVEYRTIARSYIRHGSSTLEQNLELLTRRLTDYDAGVYRCLVEDIPAAVTAAMQARGKSGLLRAADIPAAWLPADYRFPLATGMAVAEIDGHEGVLTACAAAIAFTGTLILRHGPKDAARALTLVPDYHLCVVLADQVVETVPEGFARLRGMETLPITTVSGPSATADIEMTRVKGVHGPRFLDVIIAG